MKRVSWFRSRLTAAPKMTVKSHFPWPIKLVFIAVVVGVGAIIALWTYDMGRSLSGMKPAASKEQLLKLREEVVLLSSERDKLSSTADTAQSMLDMARSAQAQLAAQVTALEAENIRLKENLSFFESLLPVDTGPGGVAIRGLKVELVAPSQLRYRILVMQGGKGIPAFSGSLQLALTVLQEGKNTMLNFPNEKSAAADKDKYALGFKHYQRLEGVITLPEGITVKTVQARVLDKGKIRAQQSVNL